MRLGTAFVAAVGIAVALAWLATRSDDPQATKAEAEAETKAPDNKRTPVAANRRPTARPPSPPHHDKASAFRVQFRHDSPQAREAKATYNRVVASVELTEEQEREFLLALYDAQMAGRAIHDAIDPPPEEALRRWSYERDEDNDTSWTGPAYDEITKAFQARIIAAVGKPSYLRMNHTYPMQGLHHLFSTSQALEEVPPIAKDAPPP